MLRRRQGMTLDKGTWLRGRGRRSGEMIVRLERYKRRGAGVPSGALRMMVQEERAG
jgi:hypothetical protein